MKESRRQEGRKKERRKSKKKGKKQIQFRLNCGSFSERRKK
jgi:hypothetical protein